MLKERQTQFASEYSLTYDELHLLMASCNATELTVVLELLKAKKHRSNFRASCTKQVRDWLKNENRKLKPLSPKQLIGCVPTWPTNHTIPR